MFLTQLGIAVGPVFISGNARRSLSDYYTHANIKFEKHRVTSGINVNKKYAADLLLLHLAISSTLTRASLFFFAIKQSAYQRFFD